MLPGASNSSGGRTQGCLFSVHLPLPHTNALTGKRCIRVCAITSRYRFARQATCHRACPRGRPDTRLPTTPTTTHPAAFPTHPTLVLYTFFLVDTLY